MMHAELGWMMWSQCDRSGGKLRGLEDAAHTVLRNFTGGVKVFLPLRTRKSIGSVVIRHSALLFLPLENRR